MYLQTEPKECWTEESEEMASAAPMWGNVNISHGAAPEWGDTEEGAAPMWGIGVTGTGMLHYDAPNLVNLTLRFAVLLKQSEECRKTFTSQKYWFSFTVAV